jgi:hypothetical protein
MPKTKLARQLLALIAEHLAKLNPTHTRPHANKETRTTENS